MTKPILTLEEIDVAVAVAAEKAKAKKSGPKIAKAFDPKAGSDQEARSVVTLKCASEFTATPISWVWPGWLARGKAHILGGQPGAGKTTLAMKFAAAVTTGGRWPDDTRATKGNVVIWSGEDDPADTLVPRLAASRADLNRVFFVQDVFDGKERRSFDPAKDIGPLKQAIEAAGGAVLIIIDPIVNAVAGDSHKNGETRRALQPLVNLASDVGAALLGITHFSKGTSGREPIERITGSIAFGALARVVMVAAKEPEAEDGTAGRRMLARAKSNIGPDEGGFAYSLQLVPMPDNANIEASVAVWGERIDGTARDMLAVAESADDNSEGTALREAKDFLLDFLMDGSKPARVVQAAARDAGHSLATIRRAKDALGITSAKNGSDGAWRWALPQGAQQYSMCSQPETVSALNTLSTLKEKQRVRAEHDAQGAQGAQGVHRVKVEHLGQDDNGGTPIDGWEGEI